jgi:arginine repressor
MARKSGGPNKSQAIRAYKSTHKRSKPKEIAAALAKEGVTVTPAFVSTVLSTARRKKGKGTRRPAAKAASGGSAYSQLIQARKLADQMGGIDKAREALDALAKILGA